jgi:two-component system phosphate regulon sensor histidine kinase PhoR
LSFAKNLKKDQDQILYIDEQCKEIGKTTGTRVTIILPSGLVAGDSFGNINRMENHMKQPEIREALKRKKGVSLRYSATLDKNMIYIALPVMLKERVTAIVRHGGSHSMEQAIINLVDNAIKYSHENKTIAIMVSKTDTTRDIVIKDNGWGIDKEHLSKIFNRFYRVDRA